MLIYAFIEFFMILGMLLFIAFNGAKNFINADGSWKVGYCVFTTIVYVLILVALYFTTILPNIKHYYIIKNGIKTNGKIIKIERLWYLNNRPKVKFTIEVLNDDDTTFVATVKGMLRSDKILEKFEIGDWLPVFYDVKNKYNIAIAHPDISTIQLHLLSTKTKRQT